MRFRLMRQHLASIMVYALGAMGLASCSSGLEKPHPQPLQPITHTAVIKTVWTHKIGNVNAWLRPAVVNDTVVVGNTDGNVAAYNLLTGQQIWTAQVAAPLVAGIGTDGRYVAVVSNTHQLVVLENGQLKWRTPLGSKVVTPPLVAGNRIFVQSLDRRVVSFDAATGRKLWSYQPTVDPLALVQAGVMEPVRDLLWIGVGAKLVALDPLKGLPLKELAITIPRGSNEIERLTDQVGPVAKVGQILCTRSFQTAIGCVDTALGRLLWSNMQGGTQGLAMDQAQVYSADANDRITARSLSSGDITWRAEKLLYRTLTAPTRIKDYVAFGDAEGYIHLLSPDTGEIVGRSQLDNINISTPMIAVGTHLVVLTQDGGLYVLSVN